MAFCTIVVRSVAVRNPESSEASEFGRHLLHQLVTVPLHKRGPKRQQLVEGQAQRIGIGPVIDGPLKLFRSHVSQRAKDVAGVCQVLLITGFRQSEVR